MEVRDHSEAFTSFRRAIQRFSKPSDNTLPWRIKRALDPEFQKAYGTPRGGKNVDDMWFKFFAEHWVILPDFITPKLYDHPLLSPGRIRSLRGNWGPKSARNEDVAFAAYFCCHLSNRPDVNDSARLLDLQLLGRSFVASFGVLVPRTSSEARELEDAASLKKASGSIKEHHASNEAYPMGRRISERSLLGLFLLERVRHVMKHATQARVAHELGFSTSMLSMWLTGKQVPSTQSLRQIARGLAEKADNYNTTEDLAAAEDEFIKSALFLREFQNGNVQEIAGAPKLARAFLERNDVGTA